MTSHGPISSHLVTISREAVTAGSEQSIRNYGTPFSFKLASAPSIAETSLYIQVIRVHNFLLNMHVEDEYER